MEMNNHKPRQNYRSESLWSSVESVGMQLMKNMHVFMKSGMRRRGEVWFAKNALWHGGNASQECKRKKIRYLFDEGYHIPLGRVCFRLASKNVWPIFIRDLFRIRSCIISFFAICIHDWYFACAEKLMTFRQCDLFIEECGTKNGHGKSIQTKSRTSSLP